MVVVALVGTTLGGAVGGRLGYAGVGVGVTVTVKIGVVGSGMGLSGEGCKIHQWMALSRHEGLGCPTCP